MMEMKIVVRMPNWIGDAVMSLPVLGSLAASGPEVEVWAAGQPWVGDLLSPELRVRGALTIGPARGLKALRRETAALRAHRFDAGLLLTNSFGTAFLFRAAGIPERWGYARDGRSPLLTRRVRVKDTIEPPHQREYYLDLLRGLGFAASFAGSGLAVAPEEKAAAERRLDEAGRDRRRPLVILNPGAAYGPAKRWPADRFAALGRLFQSRAGADILLVGSAGEKDIAAAVAAGLERPALSFAGRTSLRELVALIGLGRLFVTNDTGPMHIADALGTPILAIFGPTEPVATGPVRSRAEILKADVPCWPCLYRECPYDHRCMTGIGPEEAFEAGRRLL
jgi:lipopolysaccharide heptosyltransferase II